jgi:hypothetical protein
MKRLLSGIALSVVVALAVVAPAFAGDITNFDIVEPQATTMRVPLDHSRFGSGSGLTERELGNEALSQIKSGPFGPTTSTAHMIGSTQDLIDRGLEGLAVRDATQAYGLKG